MAWVDVHFLVPYCLPSKSGEKLPNAGGEKADRVARYQADY